jgi:hypothetical protein
LFSNVPESVVFGAKHYRRHTPDMSTMLNQLFEKYRLEGHDMPYTIEDFRLDVAREQLKNLTAEERMKGIPAEKRLEGLSDEEIESYLHKRRQSKQNKKAVPRKKAPRGRGKR